MESAAAQLELRRRRRSTYGLLAALGVDNLGSGLFLPLALVYSTQVLGLSIETAGAVLFAGSLLGLAAPFLVATVVDRLGARTMVITSQVVQATGMVGYLAADAAPRREAALALATAAALLVAAGTQTFYSALFTLVSSVAGDAPKDGAFARVEMVRSAAFGLGALAAAALLARYDAGVLDVAVAANAASFLTSAGILWRLVPRSPPADTAAADPSATPARAPAAAPPPPEPAPRPWRDRPFLVLLVVIAATGLAVDVFLVGFAVWALGELAAPTWTPGACVAVLTAVNSSCAALVLRLTRSWTRTRAVSAGTTLIIAWCLACIVAPAIAASWLSAWLLGSTVVLAVAGLLIGPRALAMAEASAPAAARGRYLATVQYSFTAAQLVAPLLVGLFALGSWLPWALVIAACSAALFLLPWLSTRLPARAVVP